MIAQGTNSTENLSEILKQISETSMLNYYFKISDLPTKICSLLREENNPSFSLVSPDGNKVYYTDFATGEYGGMINLLMKYWNLPFKETLSRIVEDIPLITANASVQFNGIYTKSNKVLEYHSDVELGVSIREWKKHDLEHWESYGISQPWLAFGKIFPISFIFITKNGKKAILPAEKFAYVYLENKDDIVSIKIYQPYSELFKWRNQHNKSVWDLWRQLPQTGDNLIITSSRKDALCVWENARIPSCSLQAESYLPKFHVVQELKNRFKNVFVLYDNDFMKKVNHGRIYGNKVAEAFGLNQIEIPETFQSKDPSDLAKNHGRKIINPVIKELMADSIKNQTRK